MQLLLHVAHIQKLLLSTYNISCDVESKQCCQLSKDANTHSCSHLFPDKFECPFCQWDGGEACSKETLQRLQVTAL